MTLADFLSSLDSTPLLGDQDAVLKALQEARGGRQQLQQPSLEEKLAALSNMSLSNCSKVSSAAGSRAATLDGYASDGPHAVLSHAREKT